MGARLRLKTNVGGADPARRTADPNVRKIFRAMQKYGLIVADNGSDLYITGTFDTRWNNDILNPAFATLSASDFDVVQLGWKPTSTAPALGSLGTNPTSVVGGQPARRHDHAHRTRTHRRCDGLGVEREQRHRGSRHRFGCARRERRDVRDRDIRRDSDDLGDNLRCVQRDHQDFRVDGNARALALEGDAQRNTVRGGVSFLATVTLSAPAPSGGTTVAVTSSTLPRRAAGERRRAGRRDKGNDDGDDAPTQQMTAVTISAFYAGVTRSAKITITVR